MKSKDCYLDIADQQVVFKKENCLKKKKVLKLAVPVLTNTAAVSEKLINNAHLVVFLDKEVLTC